MCHILIAVTSHSAWEFVAVSPVELAARTESLAFSTQVPGQNHSAGQRTSQPGIRVVRSHQYSFMRAGFSTAKHQGKQHPQSSISAVLAALMHKQGRNTVVYQRHDDD